ncbi:GNAT family protein [Candidatus Albibeggiatoa sp. nov. BB20]|uniref:GNAT family N-acetyltransferase n=1 Tax=Candidatus Albibeggiatoa sp. nov. BB20 TaxID=3162723 RepID=UPI003365AC6E
MTTLTLAPITLQPLQGKKVILERSAPEHVQFLQKCYQDKEFMDLYRLVQSRTESEQSIIHRLEKENCLSLKDLKKLEWVIFRYEQKGDEIEKEPIGLVSLADYQPKHQHAEFLIGILPPEYRRTGLALEASLLTFDLAFNFLKLNKLVVLVYGYNQNAQDNVLQLGFTQEGLMREQLYENGQFIDLYMDGLLVKDFRENRRLAKLSRYLVGKDITFLPPEVKPLSPQELKNVQKALNQQFKK